MATASASDVAIGVAEIAQRGPAPGARGTDNAKRSITFIPPELAPWRVRIDFVVYVDSERPGEREYVSVGQELAVPISIEGAEEHYEIVGPQYAKIRAKFAKHPELYEHLGELLLRRKNGELKAVARALRGEAQRYHPLLVADYRARRGTPSPIDDLATAYHVDRSTIYRHLRKSVAEGLISAEELPH